MSFDDDLRERMQQAADEAGADANPGAARVALQEAAAHTPGIGLRLIAGLGAVGLAIGGLIGATALRPGGSSPAAAAQIEAVAGVTYTCPGGAEGRALLPGDRVFMVGRDEAGDWVAIRNPEQLDEKLWVPTAGLVPDRDGELPVVECDQAVDGSAVVPVAATTSTTTPTSSTTSTTSTTTSTSSTSSTTSTTSTTTPSTSTTTAATTPPATTLAPTTTTTATTTPATTTAPTTTAAPTTTTTTEPADTTDPTIGSPSVSGTDDSFDGVVDIYEAGSSCTTTSLITVSASDNIGVTSVTGTWSGLGGSPLAFSLSNGVWAATFGPFSGLASSAQHDITITITARDAAGNSDSTQAEISVWDSFWCFG